MILLPLYVVMHISCHRGEKCAGFFATFSLVVEGQVHINSFVDFLVAIIKSGFHCEL